MITYEQIKKANDATTTIALEKLNKKTGKTESKDYTMVNQRIKAFRMVYPEGFIETFMESNADGVCIIRAEVGYYAENGSRVLIASGTAYEKEGSSFINQTSYIENCETSAVGRALGMAGYGIDDSVASYEEVSNAKLQQQKEEPKKERKASSTQVEILAAVYKGENLRMLLEANGITKLEDISMHVASSIISKLKERSHK